METDVLKNFIKMEVEVLVAGVWISGFMTPIVKGVVTLLAVGQEKEFYGPTAVKAEVIQAIRQVRRQPQANTSGVPNADSPNPTTPVQSALGANSTPGQHPGSKFVHRAR